MVNGYCFGGAFTAVLPPATSPWPPTRPIFGLSEVNWGIIPGGVVAWNVVRVHGLSRRHVVRDDGRDL